MLRQSDKAALPKYGRIAIHQVRLNQRQRRGGRHSVWSVEVERVGCGYHTPVYVSGSSCGNPRSEVAAFFEPSVKCIVNAVVEQRKSAHKGISVRLLHYLYPMIPIFLQHVVLVGGFSASDWLFEKANEALKPMGLNVIRPANHV